VFALQDEIAQRIGAALKLSLGVSAPVAARAPIDPEAYDEYLKGRALLRQRSDLPAAIAHLKAAVAKAPEFAAAWSSLSLTYEVSFWFTAHMTPALAAEFLAGQAAAAERAAALEPDAATTEHALGNVARAQFHYADAELKRRNTKRRPRRPSDAQLSAPALDHPTPRPMSRVE
jgi:tetratricopeptide (TPR) repeat protein